MEWNEQLLNLSDRLSSMGKETLKQYLSEVPFITLLSCDEEPPVELSDLLDAILLMCRDEALETGIVTSENWERLAIIFAAFATEHHRSALPLITAIESGLQVQGAEGAGTWETAFCFFRRVLRKTSRASDRAQVVIKITEACDGEDGIMEIACLEGAVRL